jgi:uncharacterized protein YsxB (DUF464 family)
MLSVEFRTDGKSISFSAKGHAGAGQKGYDLVCASASMLAYTLAGVLRKMYEESSLHEKADMLLEEGNSLIKARPVEGRYNECLHAFFVIQTGYELLARSYPKYVRLIKFEQPV